MRFLQKKRNYVKYGFFALFLLAAKPLLAQSPAMMKFGFPVACEPEKTCWVVNYIDTDPTEGNARDYRCGNRTYDEHHGTDIALRDWVEMAHGVSVLAAADGKILRVRDEIEDRIVTDEERKDMLTNNKGCGNGVVIDHGNGWNSFYCHLKKDSIEVKPGDTVTKGRQIAMVGHSGATEFPHLHFGTTFEAKSVDPFTGKATGEGCGTGGQSLWDTPDKITYNPAALYAGGFKTGVPDFDTVKKSTFSLENVSAGSTDVLTFWVGIYGAETGDRVDIKITKPDGFILAEKTMIQDRPRARQFYYIGKKFSSPPMLGTYKATATLKRTGQNGMPVSRYFEKNIVIRP